MEAIRIIPTRPLAPGHPAVALGRGLATLVALAAILVAPAVARGADTATQIHYTYTGPGSVTFDWVGAATDIRYGATSAYGSTATAHPPSPVPTDSAGPFQEADITGLQPGAGYHYSIGGGSDHTFATAPTGSFRFDVEADIGAATSYPNVAVTQQAIAADDPAFVLAAGDLSYASNGSTFNAAKVAGHFDDVMAWSTKAAYMPAWGNHDWPEPGSTSPPDDLGNYKGRFKIPNGQDSGGPPAGSGEDWGWFDAGGVRFISYPEPFGGSATWTSWQTAAAAVMAAAQADPAIRYIVTFGHRPAYSTGSHLPEAKLTAALDGFGDQYSKYVLNINGHSHDYERFFPAHRVTHITAGGGGASLEPPWRSADTDGHPRAMHLEHLRIDVDAQGIHIQSVCGPATSADDMTCVAGSVIDSYTIGPPSVTLAEPPDGVATADATPTFSGSAGTAADQQGNGDVSVSVYGGGSAAGTPVQTLTAPVGPDGTWSVAPSAPLPDGSYTAEASQTGDGGRGVSNDRAFTVDTLAPSSAASAPGTSSSRTIAVGYSAADGPGGSGLASVELWARSPGDPVYTPIATDTSPGTGHTFLYTIPAGSPDGAYDFYTQARDLAGNEEDAPPVPDATTTLTTTAPGTTPPGPTPPQGTAPPAPTGTVNTPWQPPSAGAIAGPGTSTPLQLTLAVPARQRLRTARSKGLAVRLGCSQPCRYEISLMLARRTARQLRIPGVAALTAVGTRSGAWDTARSGVAAVRLTPRARLAFARLARVTLVVDAQASGATGPVARSGVTVVLRR